MPLAQCLLASPATADVAQEVPDHNRPDYAGFAAVTAERLALDTCDTATLQPAFDAAWNAWNGVAHLHPGPVQQNGRALAIAFWPDAKSLGAKG